MSVNRREEILSRLKTILDGVAGFVQVFRNRGLVNNDQKPAAVLLDGSESVVSNVPGRGRQQMAASVVLMKPQIFILLKTQQPQNEDIGQTLNTFRGEVIRAIAADTQLLALIGPNGELSYDGAETDLNTGMSIEGQMQIDLSIRCVLNPNA